MSKSHEVKNMSENVGRRKKAKTSSPSYSIEEAASGAIIIENISPSVDGGRFPVKTIANQQFVVEADIFKDGHNVLKAAVLYRQKKETRWVESPMAFLANDRWQGVFTPNTNTRYVYTVEAWVDRLATWIVETGKKAAVFSQVKSEAQEGILLLDQSLPRAPAKDEKKLKKWRDLLKLSNGSSEEILRMLADREFLELAAKYPIKELKTCSQNELELIVDRKRAEYGAWYELFPRSQGTKKNKSGTFKDCIKRLPEVKKMGFDVIYLPPIHPIGVTNRKGPNNSLKAGANSPGSPWAIGSKEGGHKSVHPELGALKDFENFVAAASDYGIEIALDFAIQCSPDHPYVKEHPEWFYHLPDGSIRFAENPPKKYEDIYPINFHCENYRELWEELKSVVLFWIERGVKIFRVDNPHTKPLEFWKWLIESVQNEHPEVIFLAEAFTRPKVMKRLAKAGFTQSYTYFTWRNYKWEIQQYLEELTQTDMRHYFRGNFFANTPDILSEILQTGGRPAFKMRLALAATLSSTYGIYSGFELCESRVLKQGSEEYLDSEKYEYKVWDWDRPGHIKEFITRMNRIRAEHPALQQYQNLEFYHSLNEYILCFGKRTPDNSNIIVVVVNLSPHHTIEDMVTLPIWQFGLEDWQTYQMKDLITGEKYYWKGRTNYIRLDPHGEPAHIFLLTK